ncbi:MAG: isoprenyl transferase [Candidatus Tectomicrobia bacterium]|uniref:Isoprenyl transferase n=1 Tax=Tectimicrobiota bacterium TaxID=2528274 RepID=A0A933E9G4_UNCTE|nr:isoprenyl transferase [Candidatus Tectomicrobia bacterium]
MEPRIDPRIDLGRLPRHIGIIMDGNGRWAKKRFLPRIAGHREGVKAVDRVVAHARRMGVKALTLYSFSLENWSRPREEVDALMGILAEYLERELRRMLREGVRFNAIGHLEDLPPFAQKMVADAMRDTAAQEGMVLTLALSYGSRREIADAARALAREAAAGKLDPEDIEEADLARHLYTAGLPELDLLIRTSGELRLSNYLLWQAAYAELYFTDLYWPDFGEQELEAAVLDFQSRVRKFGLTEEQVAGRKG